VIAGPVDYVTYDFGNAGYDTDDPAKPNSFERVQLAGAFEGPAAITPLLYMTSGPYDLVKGAVANPVSTGTDTITIASVAIPDPAGSPVVDVDGKQNYITGFEPMFDAGGVGEQVSVAMQAVTEVKVNMRKYQVTSTQEQLE
jgi:hypothetical protein